MVHPDDLKYSASHEWVKVDKDLAKIGITDHAQSELGDVVYLELPRPGAAVQKGSVFGTIESIKTVSDLIAPLSGEVVEVNEGLPGTPELVNDDPYWAAWMITVKVADPSELDDLMTSEQYEAFVKEK